VVNQCGRVRTTADEGGSSTLLTNGRIVLRGNIKKKKIRRTSLMDATVTGITMKIPIIFVQSNSQSHSDHSKPPWAARPNTLLISHVIQLAIIYQQMLNVCPFYKVWNKVNEFLWLFRVCPVTSTRNVSNQRLRKQPLDLWIVRLTE